MSQENSQTILIIGAGAMGRLWAGYLSPSSQVIFGRRQSGVTELHYQLLSGNSPASPFKSIACVHAAGDSPVQPDLVLVTTKAPDALKALSQLAPHLPADTPVLLFQNGMGSQQAIAAAWPEMAVIAASTTEGAYLDHAGNVVHAGNGSTWLGGLTASGEAEVKNAAHLLANSGLDIQIDDDIHRRLWLKLAINAGINPFTAVLDCANGDIIGQPFFEERIAGVCSETNRLMALHGITCTAQALEAEVRAVAERTAANSSSMRQDVKAARSTEIDMMNGFIASESERRGLDAPVNRFLTDAVKAL